MGTKKKASLTGGGGYKFAILCYVIYGRRLIEVAQNMLRVTMGFRDPPPSIVTQGLTPPPPVM